MFDADESIPGGVGAQFGEEEAGEERGLKQLFEGGFEEWTQAETDQATEGDVVGGAGETFHMSGVDEGLSEAFDIGGMTEGGEGVAVIDFEDLGMAGTGPDKEDAVGEGCGEDRGSAAELVGDVFASVTDGFNPAIRFFGHDGARAAVCSSGRTAKVPWEVRRRRVAKRPASG